MRASATARPQPEF